MDDGVLRGAFIAYLKAQLLMEAIHSGGSELVRDIFYVFRRILDRIDNAQTGELLKFGTKHNLPALV